MIRRDIIDGPSEKADLERSFSNCFSDHESIVTFITNNNDVVPINISSLTYSDASSFSFSFQGHTLKMHRVTGVYNVRTKKGWLGIDGHFAY